LISGVVLFGLSYGTTAFAGYKLQRSCGTANDFGECKKMARNMYIPVAGPFMNLRYSDKATDKFGMAFAGGAQAPGALLTVIGAIIYHRDGVKNRILNEHGVALGTEGKRRNLALGADGGAGGGRVKMTYRF
jgi:hypothetical protein